MEYPGLKVLPTVADLADPLPLPRGLPGPHLFAFLGSTIGNFRPKKAAALLRRIHAALDGDDFFLLGVDLRKDVALIKAFVEAVRRAEEAVAPEESEESA